MKSVTTEDVKVLGIVAVAGAALYLIYKAVNGIKDGAGGAAETVLEAPGRLGGYIGDKAFEYAHPDAGSIPLTLRPGQTIDDAIREHERSLAPAEFDRRLAEEMAGSPQSTAIEDNSETIRQWSV